MDAHGLAMAFRLVGSCVPYAAHACLASSLTTAVCERKLRAARRRCARPRPASISVSPARSFDLLLLPMSSLDLLCSALWVFIHLAQQCLPPMCVLLSSTCSPMLLCTVPSCPVYSLGHAAQVTYRGHASPPPLILLPPSSWFQYCVNRLVFKWCHG